MYDILFIDDKFEEIKDSFSYFQKEHIRCFYSDGESHLPKNDKARLPFKNLKYISLDVHLENRGNNSSTPKKTTLSTLASVIKSFVSDGKGITIIVNTSFPGDFIESEFFEYLDFNNNPTIEKKEKNNLISLLSGDDITQQAHQEILRNVIIREAIEVENLIYAKVRENFRSITPKLSCNKLDKIKKFDFKAKIQLYELASNDNALGEKLNKLRELRNKFAHGNNPPEVGLLDFLEQVESLKKGILEFTS